MFSKTMFVLLAVIAGALAGPITYQKNDEGYSCARKCSESNKFRYAPGMTYDFDYDIQTHTAMEGASGERAALGIRAIADIEVLSKCDMALRLRDVRVYRSDPTSTSMKYVDESGEFRRQLERYPLRFSFQDGVIEELCPLEGESTWALNIKRGLLTAVQNSMDSLDKDQKIKESDVTGECSTNYTVVSSGWYSNTRVKKTKDLLGCTDRDGYRSHVHAMPYRVPSEIQSLPLMKSSHECEQEIDKNGLLSSALMKEIHTFRPFSQGTSGATTKIIQKLDYKTKRSGVATKPEYIQRRAGVAFEHAYGPGNEDQPRQDAENKLRDICSGIREDIRPETPRHFSELVYIVKNMDIESLRTVYQQVKQGKVCADRRIKKFFLDALPMASTGASIQLMKDVLLSDEVTGAQATMWISSLSFIHYPTEEMLQQVQTLLENPRYSKQSMLPISTMVNNYCSHRESCSEEYVVERIISAIEKVIGRGCNVRDSDLDATMVALRALGNAGHLDRISRILSTCINRESNPTEVRVTAIQAFRRIPCTSDRSGLMTVYQDSDEDSEVRIAAYLAIMQCPDEDILRRVQETLENERVNQVGSFVWSHLTNLIETSSPHKQSMRKILEDQTLKKEFDLETLKYSRNYEGSLFLEKFNTGAMAESNVIFSDKSFLPRSVMVNMTVDLFGNSVNLFEMGGRVEGLEYLIETYLGPYSYFGSAKKPETSVKLDHLRGDIYMRMFGNELFYNHFMGTDPLASAKKFNLLDMLIQMSDNKDYSFTQSVMFIDSSMIVPTSCGLPLNLTVNGTATIDLQATGVVDLRKLTTSPKSLLIDGVLKPSGAIQITGTMSMDAFVTKTGLRVVNTWHSSSALKGRVELQRGKVISADWELPQNKMEILDVSTAFFSIHGDLEREQDLLADSSKSLELCTGSRLATITGLEICNEFKWTNASMKEDAPYFPFTGPFSQTLTLFKRDSHSAYKFKAAVSATPYSTGARIEFNTPGSKVDREMAINFDLSSKQKHLDISLVSPWKKAEVKGSLDYKKDNIGMKGKLIVDGTSEYSVISGVGIRKAKNMITYTPQLEVRRPGVKVIKLAGQVSHDGLKKANVNLQLDGIKNDPITLSGTLSNTRVEGSAKAVLNLEPKQDYSAEIGLVYQNFGKSKAIIKIVPTLIVKTPSVELVTVSGSGDYREGKSLKASVTIDAYKVLSKPIIVKCDLKRTSGSKDKFSGFVMINSKVVVAKMSGNMQMKKNILSSTVTLDYNFPKIRSIKKDRISFSSKFTDRSTKSLWNYQLNTNFQDKRYPAINFVTNNEFAHNKKLTKVSTSLRYGPKEKTSNRHLTVFAMVNHVLDTKTKLDCTIQTEIGPLDTKLNLKGRHINDGRSLDSSMTLGYGTGKTIETSLSLKNKGRKSINLYGEASVAYPGKQLNLKTDLVQARKDFTHTITVQLDKATSSMVTTYTHPKESIHRITSTIEPHFTKPIQLQAETDLDLKDFKASALANYDGAAYGASTTYKYSPNTNGKWSLDVSYPARHVIVEVEGGKKGNNFQGNAVAKWDADRDVSKTFVLKGKLNQKPGGSFASSASLKYPSRNIEFNVKHAAGRQYSTRADLSWEPRKKIQVDTSFMNVESRKGRSVVVSLRVRSPFEGYEDMFAKATSDDSAKRYATTTQMYWSGKKNQLSSTISITKPYSLRNLDLSVTATSPFKGYKKINVEASHSLDSGLKTIIKANVEGKSAKITINGENRSNWQKRDIEGSLTVKSTIKGMKGLTVQVSHTDNLRKFSTDALLNIEGDKYTYGFDMNHEISGWQMQNNGKMILSTPRHRLVNNWQHRNSDKDVSSTLTSEWGRGRRIFINIFGKHDATQTTKTLGEINIESPWAPIRKMEFNLEHEFGTGLLKHSSSIKQGNDVTGSVGMNYIRTNGQATADFKVLSPLTNLNGKTEARYNDFPMTGHAEVGWAPYKKISFDGSLSSYTSNNFDSSLRLTSPFENIRDIMVKASNKKEGSDIVSRASLNYDIRKSLEFESNINTDNLNKFRATIKTPFDDYKSLEAGVEYTGGHKNFDGRANFGIIPVLGNFAGIVNWNLDSDVAGKLRLETPFSEFQYIQILARSEQTGKARHSVIETEYYPRKTISLDTTYSLSVPLSVDATVKTPFMNMEHMSTSIKHAFRKSSLQSHIDVTLAPTVNFGGDLRLKWANGLTGTLLVNTPFMGFETSKLSFRHEGTLQAFKCHGEAEFARETGEADLTFQHGPKTSASFILKTPFQGYEDTVFSVSRRGPVNDMRGQLSLQYGTNQKIDISAQNKFSAHKLDSTLIVKSPFSEDMRITIDHDGGFGNFKTKVFGNVGSRHAINSESTFTLRYPLIDMSTNFKYTLNWKGRNIGLKVHKNGYLDDINAKITGMLDDEQIELTSTFKNGRNIEGSISAKTPFTNFESVGISLKNTGNLQQISTEGRIQYMKDKVLEGKLTLWQSGPTRIDTRAQFKTPFQGFDDITLNYRHSIGYPKTTSSAMLTYGYDSKISSELDLDMSSKLNLNFEVKTPFNGMKTNRIVATHDGPIENCQSHLEVELLGRTMSGDSSFEHGSDTRGSLSYISNIDGIESFRASFSKEGTLENFRGAASATLIDSTIEADINGRFAEGTVQGTATLKTPFRNFRDTSISVDHSGSLNDFSSEGLIRYMNGQTLEGKIKLSQAGFKQVSGTVQLKTPFQYYEMMSIDHSHRIRPSSLTSKSAITYGYGKEITSDISLEAARDITINAVVKTPFQGYKESKTILTVTGYLANFNSHAEVHFHNTDLSMDAAYSMQRSTQGNVEVATNIPGYENMKGRFSIEGDRTYLKSSALINLKESTIEAGVNGQISHGILQGTVSMKTPFTNFRDIAISVDHSSNLNGFNSEGFIRYMDGQTLEGKVKLSQAGLKEVTGSLQIKTPFRQYEMMSIDHSHKIKPSSLTSNSVISFGIGKKIISDISLDAVQDITLNAVIKTPFQGYEQSRAIFTVTGSMENFNSHSEVQFYNTELGMTASFAKQRLTQGNIEITTNIPGYENMKGTFSIKGDRTNLKSSASINLKQSTIEAEIGMDLRKKTEVYVILKTPFNNFRNVGASVNQTYSPLHVNTEGSIRYMDGKRIAGKVQLIFTRTEPIFNCEITTPLIGFENQVIAFKMSRQGPKTTLNLDITNGNSHIITAKVDANPQSQSLTADLRTPFIGFEKQAIEYRQTIQDKRVNANLDIGYGDNRKISARFDANGNNPSLNAELTTPFIGFYKQSINFRQVIQEHGGNGNIDITYGNSQKIALTVKAMWKPKIDISAEIQTPFASFKRNRIAFEHEGEVGNCKTSFELQALGKSINANSEMTTSPVVRGNINIATNIESFESMKMMVKKEGDMNNLKAMGSVSLRDSTVEATLSNVFTSRRLSTKLTLKNPYTEDIDMQLDFNGRPLNFKNKVSASMGSDTGISSDLSFRVRGLTIDTTSLMSYTLAGAGASGRMKFHKEGTLSDLKMRLDGEYNGKKSRAVVELRAVDGAHGEVMISTPFRGYRNLGMSFDHYGEWNTFNTRAMVEYMDRREISAKLSHMNKGLDRIESSIELNTPFTGYEVTKAQLQHSATTSEINSNAALQYGRGQKLTSVIRASSSPKYDFDVKVTTPFSEYREVSASSSLEHGMDRYSLQGKLNAGYGKQFAVDSTIDLSSSPMTAVAHLSTPFDKLDSAEISLSHDGQLNNFHSTGRLETPMTGPLSGEATLNYQSPLEMNGMIALSNDKKFSVQNTQTNGKYISNVLLAWSPNEEVAFEGGLTIQDEWTEKRFQTNMALRTPFDLIRQAAVRYDHLHANGKYNDKIEADFNGNTVLDMDVELERGSRDQGSITMRQPRPMAISLSGGIVDKNLDGEMFVNWDRDEPQSNIRVQTTVTDRSGSSKLDKDLTLKVIHPSRTVGINGNIMHSAQQTKSHGEFTWNEDAGDKIFYDVAMTDRSRRYNTKYDTTVKLGSPLRSIQMDGSYGNTGASRSVDGAFYWDADRDNSKQVGLKATLTPGDNNKKADLSLRLPSIGKDIKLDTEMVINNGRTLFNGQTKLSYSTDSRKTLTMTSRLEDISYGSSNSNYSLSVGVSHPYTDVDVQMTSHIGSSSEKYSTGMNLVYLTARRERKNLALRGEINNLRKQIELQMMTPLKNIELSAEVEENPYKLKIRNKFDGKTMRSDLTVDSSRKLVEFQTNYDLDDLSKMIHMNAGYVNSSAVQAVIFHEINSRQISDNLFAVRLNTSRLLHTRISWRPQMIRDLQNFLAAEVKQYGEEVKNAFHSTYEAVGKELSGKYYRVAQAVTEEAAPLVKLLESELAGIERNLDSIRRDVRRMVRRNDFFLADMGDYFNRAFEAYKEFVYSTKETFATVNQKIVDLLNDIKHYPVGQRYQVAVADVLGSMKRAVDNVVAETVEMIASMDEELQGIRDSYNHHYNRIQNTVSDSMNNIRNHPKLTELRLRFAKTYQEYLNSMSNSLQQLNLNDKYNSVMDSARNTLTSQLSRVMHPDDLKQVISLSNNVYQEGVWAYNYWQVEENLKTHLRSIIEILQDLVEDELKQYRDELVFLQKSRITVWDPQHGEIQIELYLPIPLESLDTLPDFQPYVQRAKSAVTKYIPERTTITRYYNNYIPTYLWQSKNETSPQVQTDHIIPRRPRGQIRRYNAVPI